MLDFFLREDAVNWSWQNMSVLASKSSACLNVRESNIAESEDPKRKESNNKVKLDIFN